MQRNESDTYFTLKVPKFKLLYKDWYEFSSSSLIGYNSDDLCELEANSPLRDTEWLMHALDVFASIMARVEYAKYYDEPDVFAFPSGTEERMAYRIYLGLLGVKDYVFNLTFKSLDRMCGGARYLEMISDVLFKEENVELLYAVEELAQSTTSKKKFKRWKKD